MLKRIMLMLMVVMLLGGVTACNSNSDKGAGKKEETSQQDKQKSKSKKDSKDAKKDTAKTENMANKKTNGDSKGSGSPSAADKDAEKKMKELDFAEIEIEVEYDDDQEYTAEIKKNSKGEFLSEVDDDLINNHLRGQEAFDHLYPIVKKISVHTDSTMDEVINEVLNAFELEKDYREFEAEFTFHDGRKLEYKDK